MVRSNKKEKLVERVLIKVLSPKGIRLVPRRVNASLAGYRTRRSYNFRQGSKIESEDVARPPEGGESGVCTGIVTYDRWTKPACAGEHDTRTLVVVDPRIHQLDRDLWHSRTKLTFSGLARATRVTPSICRPVSSTNHTSTWDGWQMSWKLAETRGPPLPLK